MIRIATHHVPLAWNCSRIVSGSGSARQFDCLRSELRGSGRGEVGHVVAVFNIGVPRTDAAAPKQIESKKGRVTNG
jgi:hypothetical protein